MRIFGSILSLLISSVAFAQSSMTDGVLINAESMDRDSVKQTVRLDGKVQLVFQGQHISCDHAVLFQKTNTIEATGRVILTNESVHIEGSKIVFNYKTNTGTIFNGFVQSDQVVFEGSVIEKTGPQNYVATDAQYTACATCPPAWSFSGRRIEAELGGYARISRPVFRIAGFPVMILPGLIVPLKSARQTGILVPSLSRSTRGGWAVAESFFWALSKSQDLTLTAKNYEFRGPKGMAEYRYMLSDNSRGQFSAAAIQDRMRLIDPPIKIGSTIDHGPSNFTRWFFTYDHHYEMPEDYVHRVNLKNISDLRYIRDFPDEIQGYGDPALENKASLTKNSESVHMSGEVDMYHNLLKTYPLARNDDAVHRFPDLKYSLKETQLFENIGLWFKLDANYVNFSRQNYSYDDLELAGQVDRVPETGDVGPHGEITRDGEFDLDSDLIRTGQRLDLKPSFSYPMQFFKTIDFVASVNYRETQYHFDVPRIAEENRYSSTAARRYLETNYKMKTEFNRVFGNLSDPKATRWKHSIQPEISYTRSPWMRQPNHGFFGGFSGTPFARMYEPISNADLTKESEDREHKLQFDYNDRTFNKNIVDFSFTNYLIRKSQNEDGGMGYRRVALFRLAQSYDIYEATAGTFKPWSPITALLDLRLNNFETYTLSSYNGYAKLTNTSSRIKYFYNEVNFAQVSYTRNTLVTAENRQISESETENIGLGAGIDTKYFGFMGELDYSNITFNIRSWKYELHLRPPGKCWVIKLHHEQVLGGDANISGSVDFDFGGSGEKIAAQK